MSVNLKRVRVQSRSSTRDVTGTLAGRGQVGDDPEGYQLLRTGRAVAEECHLDIQCYRRLPLSLTGGRFTVQSRRAVGEPLIVKRQPLSLAPVRFIVRGPLR